MQQIKQAINRIRRKIYKIKERPFYFFTFPYRMATAKKRVLPDFLIIGAQNGGTNSLRHFLSQHPQVQMPFLVGSELHYFDRDSNYKKGDLWYRAHFPFKDKIKSGDTVGETTPTYLRLPDAAKRIQKDLPNAKLICLLRNPTERAISNYFMLLHQGEEHYPIMAALLGEETPRHAYIKRGLYLEQLKRYESYLRNGQLLVLSSEEFFANPQKILKQVFEFLGVDETFKCPDLSPKHVGKNKTPVPPEAYKYLDAYFKPHNRSLYKYLNRDFGWSGD